MARKSDNPLNAADSPGRPGPLVGGSQHGRGSNGAPGVAAGRHDLVQSLTVVVVAVWCISALAIGMNTAGSLWEWLPIFAFGGAAPALFLWQANRALTPRHKSPSSSGAKDKENEILGALAERGELTPITAAIRTSLTADEAARMLEELAGKGYLRLRMEEGAQMYALQESDRRGLPRTKKDGGGSPAHARGRPVRDRAIVFVLLCTGLRREEVVTLDLGQVEPNEPDGLRTARRVRVRGVKGKGGTERNVFLSKDARDALAEYLEIERPKDAGEATGSEALFLSAAGTPARRADGRLSVRAVNLLLERIGRWHDAEVTDPDRRISPLRPHDLRHTFAYRLAAETGKDAYELERRLGHGSQRYIQRYTNPPEEVAAGYVEQF